MRVFNRIQWRSTVMISIPALILSTAAGLSWSADYDTTNFRKQNATTQQFIEALTPNAAPAPDSGFEFRSLGRGKRQKAVSMELNFKYDSYRLTPDAKNVLNNLGRAMQSQQLSRYRFELEGHTDGTGSASYNQKLSEKRAQSVKNYLVDNFHVSPGRLPTAGRGEHDLLDKRNPASGRNRRVQIINLE